MTAAKDNKSWALALFFFTATAVSRIPFRDRTLFSWDSGSFALALERFDLGQQRPHPPGYILYVGVGRLFELFTRSPNEALVALSIFSAALSVAGVYLVGRSIFSHTVGIVAAVLLFFSPLFWFYSEVALTYAVEVPLALLVIWLLYQMFFFRRYAVICGAVLGLAAGLRQDPLIFLGPLFLAASFRVGRRKMVLSWLALAGGVAVWLIPLVISVGSLGLFRKYQSMQYSGAVVPYSIFAKGLDGLLTNAKETLKALLWLAGPALLLLPVAAYRFFRRDRRVIFLVITTLPALAFFLVYFIDPPGYLLICAPAIILLLAQGMVLAAGWLRELISRMRLVQGLRGGARVINKPVILTLLTALMSFVSFVWFLYGSMTLDRILPGFPGYEFLFITFNAQGLRAKSESMEAALGQIRGFDHDSTVVICNVSDNVFDWRRLMYYLPEYRVIGLNLLDGSIQASYIEAMNHTERVSSGKIEMQPQVQRLVFVGQDLDFNVFSLASNQEIVRKLPLVFPDRYAPSFYAVVEPLPDGFQLGPYLFHVNQ